MQPEFIIAGAQKAATSYLHYCIKEHPDIWMPEQESPAFESPDYEQGELEKLLISLNQADDRLTGIKRPTYLYSETVCERIATHNSNTKIIIVLRNPLERTVSAYYHYMLTGFLPVSPIETGLPLIIKGKVDGIWKRASEIIRFSLYSKPVATYQNKFDSNNIKILLHEDICSHTDSMFEDIFNFLGVDKTYRPEHINSQPQRAVYSDVRIKLLQTRNRFLYEFNKDRTRLFPTEMNPAGKVYCALINVLDHVLTPMLSQKRPILSEPLRSSLAELYLDDIGRLEVSIKKDLSTWKKSLTG